MTGAYWHLPRRAVETGHVRVHKCDTQPSSRNADGHWPVGFERQLFIYSDGNEFLQLARDGCDLCSGAVRNDYARRLFDLLLCRRQHAASLRQRALQQGKVHRKGQLRAKYVVLRITDRCGYCSDLASASADGFDDIGNVVLHLAISICQTLHMAQQGSRADHINRAVSFREVQNVITFLRVSLISNVGFLDDSEDVAGLVAQDAPLAAVSDRLVFRRQKGKVSFMLAFPVRFAEPGEYGRWHNPISHRDDEQ